jgi:hypothetical protein
VPGEGLGTTGEGLASSGDVPGAGLGTTGDGLAVGGMGLGTIGACTKQTAHDAAECTICDLQLMPGWPQTNICTPSCLLLQHMCARLGSTASCNARHQPCVCELMFKLLTSLVQHASVDGGVYVLFAAL